MSSRRQPLPRSERAAAVWPANAANVPPFPAHRRSFAASNGWTVARSPEQEPIIYGHRGWEMNRFGGSMAHPVPTSGRWPLPRWEPIPTPLFRWEPIPTQRPPICMPLSGGKGGYPAIWSDTSGRRKTGKQRIYARGPHSDRFERCVMHIKAKNASTARGKVQYNPWAVCNRSTGW
jgi:hypothetical protein